MNYVWQSFIMIFVGLLFIKFSGRKAIAQMTLPQVVVMLSLGTILVQPIAQKGVGKTTIVIGVFIGTLVLLEFLQLKINGMERFFTGKSKVVIKDGMIDAEQLRKLRMTVDQLEMRLRTSGITRMEDVKTATIEPNGQLGYELNEDAKPLTAGDFKKMMEQYFQSYSQGYKNEREKPVSANIFAEIEGGGQDHPKYLQ